MTQDKRAKGKRFLFQKKQIIIALFALFSLNIQAAIPLAKNGVPKAEILIKSKSHPAVKYAAKELQHWVEEISGAELPVVNTPGKLPYRLVLSVNPEGFSDDLQKFNGNDGYAVRTAGNTVHIFGSQPKGVLNGVYKMLFKNTDIIWATPNTEYGTIFTKNPNLELTQTDYIDIPVYVLRGWLMTGGDNDVPAYIWQIRNGSNWTNHTTYSLARVKYGHVFEYGVGHNLVSRYITEKKYYDKHPEFFPLRNGKRLRPSESRHRVQLCFTNPELVDTFIKEVDARIKQNPDYDTYRIIIEDNMNICECPECLKPIKLLDGEIVKPDDKDFRSTQFFLWLNKIAQHMKKEYPEKRILTLAYFFTETPPRCKIESNIDISFCPYSKNSKAPFTSPVNTGINKKFLGWMKIGANLTLREYYGLVGPFPRPIDVIAMADWKYANKHGVNRTYSEMFPYSNTKIMDGIESWNLNSLYFWILANGPWDPYQDVKAMRKEFLKRVYGLGAGDVAEFYRLVEDGWFKAGGTSQWNDITSASWKAAVISQGNLGACREALERAAAKVTNPKGKKMLAALRGTFEKQIDLSKIVVLHAKKITSPPGFDPDFQSGDWLKAEASSKFFLRDGKDPREKTTVRVLYDDRNLYIGAKCFDREPDKAFAKQAGQPRDGWPAGDKFEIFLTGKDQQGQDAVYQIAFDINGNIYDGCNQDPEWNGNFQIFRKLTDDGRSSMIVIPCQTINLDPAKQREINAMFVRYLSHDPGKRAQVSFWQKGTVHNSNSFGKIKFE